MIFTQATLCQLVITSHFLHLSTSTTTEYDIHLTEYFKKRQPSRHSHRRVRDCQPIKYGNVTHQTQTAHGLQGDVILPIMEVSSFIDEFENQYGLGETNRGHIAVVNNPARTVSVLEPLREGGCDMAARATAVEMARKNNCLLAVNAGFFNTHTGDCLGNIVTSGRPVQNSGGVQNAHFGIRENGSLVFGYISEADVLEETNPFIQLVGGVGWILRDGEVYLEESLKAECENTEETGTVQHFFEVQSGRTVIGSDKDGRVVIAHVDGKTGSYGVSLAQVAAWLLKHDVVNAINLDGGGSTTYVINGTTVGYTADLCPGKVFRCPRKVSTVVCVHEPRCSPADCSGHGQCILGVCHCHGNWAEPDCSNLLCGNSNCSSNGRCTEDGCECDAGYRLPDCQEQCLPLTYGPNCNKQCLCQNGGYCEPVGGECICRPGYTGQYCQQICPYGRYGLSCAEECSCLDDSCPCHHITGDCTLLNNDTFWTPLMSVGHCLAKREIRGRRLVEFVPLEENSYFLLALVLAVLLSVSLCVNLSLLCFRCTCRCKSKSLWKQSSGKKYRPLPLLEDSDGL